MRFCTIMISLLSLFVSGVCEENRSSVDAQIAQMEKALEADRVKLITELKAMIVQINAKEHNDAVGKHQKKSHKETNTTNEKLLKECHLPKE